jgi:hypothetical protein
MTSADNQKSVFITSVDVQYFNADFEAAQD